MSSKCSSEQLKAEALRLGFFACSLAKAHAVDAAAAQQYRQWIAQGHHASMHYLADNIEKRLDPTLLLPGAKTIICVALNYAPARRMPDDQYQIAAYAYGQDYHDVLKNRLRQLIKSLNLAPETVKIATDTVPLLERYWATESGLGFTGRNHQLIIPGAGSQFFLGELVTTQEFDHYDSPCTRSCPPSCHRCIDACPTGALSDTFLSERCISYQTIENRDAISHAVASKLGNTIYGCDRCTRCCPFNQHAPATDIPEFQPREALLSMQKSDWHQLTADTYRQLFKGSAVKRAKYEGLMRNIRAAAEEEEKSESNLS